jgi:putative CocE/NonD family hydrolase
VAVVEEKDIRIRMRDGIRIGVRIYRPEGSGPFPTLFATSPYRYDNNVAPAIPLYLWRETGPIAWYVEHGYAYVHADVRGTGISEGTFRFLDRAEQHDAYDLIEWIAAQPWSNGRVGGIGESYYCMAQWFMGIENPPHLACLGAYDGLNDPYRYMGYPGGIEGNFLSYWFNSSVRVPNRYPANGDNPRELEHDLFLEVQRHPFYDDFWKERTAAERLDQIRVPLFSIGAWAKMDLHVAGNILGFQRAQGPKKLAITGTPSPFTAMRDFADVAFHETYLLPFYDRYLKGAPHTAYDDRPEIEFAVKNTGETRRVLSWPPPNARPVRLYLDAGPTGSVTSLNDGALREEAPASGASTSYTYPHPSWTMGVVAVGPQGPDPARGVLTFTSEPLREDLEIAGHARLVVYASTSAHELDVIVKLSEQFAQSDDERAKGIQPRYAIVTKGALRASHVDRDPTRGVDGVPFYTHERTVPLVPGQVYALDVPLQPIAYRFMRGNRIRVEIANGDSPVTDALFFHIYRPDKIGTDTIHHGADRPSHLILPVLDSA